VATGLMVAGVHRSGTSIATRLAASLGLRLPPEHDLVKPNAGNPDGYWESQSLASLNDRLLLRWGHSWRRPPHAVTPELLAQLSECRDEAASTFRACFGDAAGWVWKDPRLAALLPFWDEVLGASPVLFPYREPQAVAHSIARRDGVTYAQGLALWERCTRLALTAMAGHRIAVSDYGRLLSDGTAWRNQLLDFCRDAGLEVAAAEESVESLMRPPGSSAEGWLSAAQAELHELVRGLEGFHVVLAIPDLPRESDWVSDALLTLGGTSAAEADAQRLDRELRDEQARALGHVRRLEGALREAQDRAMAQIGRLEAELRDAHAGAAAALADRDGMVAHRDALLAEARQTEQGLVAELEAARRDRDRLGAELERVTTSRGWQALERYRASRRAVERRLGRQRPAR